jgi:predicted alpha/beta hydrolase family esterase
LSDAAPTVLIVPGLRDDMPEHWQTILQKKLRRAFTVPRIPRDSAAWISRPAWVAMLDKCVRAIQGPVVLVAHSAGVAMVAHWAQQHRAAIRGALLATPPDLETPLPSSYPTLDALRENGWSPMPRRTLPFPSIVAASTNDPMASYERVASLAIAWGSRLLDVGPVGHLNPASGFGEWLQAEALVQELASGEHA